MLTINSSGRNPKSARAHRRDFLKAGALGTTGLTLADLLAVRASAESSNRRETSVVWLWLGGGPTHVETFDPKMEAPTEYRSTTGEVQSAIPGVTIGGTLPKMAGMLDKMAIVRSFAHKNSGHGGGTHWMMTGANNRAFDNGGAQTRPSIGSILATMRGANHRVTGMPTYVRLGTISADGPVYLGAANAPFDPRGDALRNMTLRLTQDRLDNRRSLLKELDNLNRQMDSSGLMEGLSRFEEQAFTLMLGNAPAAFDLKNEDPRVVEHYGSGLGQQMLQARRLCEAGCGFVTIHYGGWDMHSQVEAGMHARSPQLDHAVATFLEDLAARGMSESVLLVICGEFGRTPKVNGNAGRDHWAPLSTLALAGGGLNMGQVVGESAAKLDVPKTTPIAPQDLMATIFHVLGIDRDVYFYNPAGRPTKPIETGKPIAELV